MAATHYSVTTFRDKTGETTTFQLPNGAITATSVAGFLTDYGALKTALDAMTSGELAGDQWVGDKTSISDALPTSNYAQREIKLELKMVGDSGGDPFTRTLGTVDLSKVEFVPGGGDVVRLDTPQEMIDLVAAIETIGRHPRNDTETITVQSARIVGRNV